MLTCVAMIQYTAKKSFCEDLTEGKFSFPIVHGVLSDPGSTILISILKQRTEDNDIKKYFLKCLRQVYCVTLCGEECCTVSVTFE